MYYNIGGVVVEISGEKARDILQLPAFEVFRTNNRESAMTINLVEAYEQFVEENVIYSLHYGDTCFNCFKVSESKYVFKIVDTVNNKKLSVSYNKNTQLATIGGNGGASLLLFALWLAYGIVAMQYKLIAVHTSVIMYEGKAVMFLGESGTGKSTHTRLWQETFEGAVLLNDDSPILKVVDDKVYVYGSPWSGKTPCYRTERVELVSIVRLSQAPYNNIKPLNVVKAFAALYPSCPPVFANDVFLSGQVCSLMSDTLSRVKVWHLKCLPNVDAAHLSFNTIFNSDETV